MADLVAPIIPDSQKNRGPDLFQESLNQGLANYARFAAMKRETEMDTLKLAEHERVSQEEHQVQREKIISDADYRTKALEISRDLNDAHINYFNSQADAYKNGTARAWQGAAAFNQQREKLVNDVNDSANELQLNDPDFATKEPVRYAANVLKFRDMYGLSPLPEVKGAIKTFQQAADQQKIQLKMLDGYGNVTGDPKSVPIWQVVKNLQDPDTKESTTAMLRANGHLTETSKKVPGTATHSWSRPFDSSWDYLFGPTDKTVEEDKPSTDLQRIQEKGEGVKFEREKSRVPSAMLRRTDARGTSGPTEMPADTSLPDPDLPPENPDDASSRNASPKFEQSETDKLIAQAKAAIAQGAPKDRVAQRLQELGIDPNLLMG